MPPTKAGDEESPHRLEVAMPKETMTPKERWLSVLERKNPDRVPMDYWATGEANEKLMKHLGCDGMWAVFEQLHIDPVVNVGPRYVGPSTPLDTDMHGCKYEVVDYGTGVYLECVYHPLAQYTLSRR
jgi:uroporphyrinogen decarboxylase